MISIVNADDELYRFGKATLTIFTRNEQSDTNDSLFNSINEIKIF